MMIPGVFFGGVLLETFGMGWDGVNWIWACIFVCTILCMYLRLHASRFCFAPLRASERVCKVYCFYHIARAALLYLLMQGWIEGCMYACDLDFFRSISLHFLEIGGGNIMKRGLKSKDELRT
jgi:hypothetical protein